MLSVMYQSVSVWDLRSYLSLKKSENSFLSLHFAFPKNKEFEYLTGVFEIYPANNLFDIASLGIKLLFFFSISPYPAEVDSNLEIICPITAASFSTSKFAIFLIFLMGL